MGNEAKKNIQEINKSVLEYIKDKVPDVSYNTWFSFIKDAYIEKDSIIINVSNSFEKAILEDRYLDLINEAYDKFKSELKYNMISIKFGDKNETLLESLNCNRKKTANDMKVIANNENSKVIDIKNEIERLLNDILVTIRIMANKGEYEAVYLYNNKDSCYAEQLENELNDLGYKTVTSKSRKVVEIKWD